MRKYIIGIAIASITHCYALDIKIAHSVCIIDSMQYSFVGYGTYPLKEKECEAALEHAIEMGYRIIDTATYYHNLDAIGSVIKRYNRHNFYIISKVWPDSHTAKELRVDLHNTLNNLQTNYLDAYLLHWPNSAVPIEETLLAMQELKDAGLIKHIGLSNVSVNHVRRAIEVGVEISWVQVEMHPSFYDPALIELCHRIHIAVQAWAPLGRGVLSKDEFLASLGRKYGKTASQIALRWILQHECLPLPGSKNKLHMRENLDVNDFVLSPEEMNTINERARNGKRERYSLKDGFCFADEFDFSFDQCWPR